MISTATSFTSPFHNVAGESIGADELLECRGLGVEYGMAVAGPLYGSAVYEAYMVPYLQHGIHVVGVYDGCHIEFPGKIADKLVYEYGCIWIKAGVGLIAEEILGTESNRPGNTHTFLHAAGKLGRIFVVAADYVHFFEAEAGTFPLLGLGPISEEVHREHDVLYDRGEIEQGASLEKHANVLVQGLASLLIHCNKAVAVIEYVSSVRAHKAYEILEKHSLSATAHSYDHVALAVAEGGIDIVQYRSACETLDKTLDFYHRLIKHNFRYDKVKHKDEYAGRYNGPRTAFAHSERTAACVIAFKRSDTADEETEYCRLETAVEYIKAVKAVLYSLYVRRGADYAGEIYNYVPSYQTEHETQEHEERAEKGGGDDFRLYEEAGGIDTHHIHGINLLRYPHAAYLGSDVGPHLTGKDKRHHCGTEFQDKALPDHISHIHLVNEGILEIGCRLDGENASDENGDDGHYEYGRNYELVRFKYELLPIKPAVFRSSEHRGKEQSILPYPFYGSFYHSVTKITIINQIRFQYAD